MAEEMICLFRDGILNGLQFEMENPPHRIRADYMAENPQYVKASYFSKDISPTDMAQPYKRGEDIYVAQEVHVRTSVLDEEMGTRIVVYRLDRSW